ncbi:MAG: type I-C CRISPR-associated endonuclease Cas1c [Eubacteriales bacterium]|nr:type I-C CRISPR-associated endonuclease Cas1c [Eubacteriales bacterium]
MRKLLNTLYVQHPNYYLSLEQEAVVISKDRVTMAKFPLLNFESIVTSSQVSISPYLLEACMERGISVSYLDRNGKFLARVSGKNIGNVLLRKSQYRYSDDKTVSNQIAKYMILGKTYNQRWLLDRYCRDHPLSIDLDSVKKCCGNLQAAYPRIRECADLDILRGIEGELAQQYFGVFDSLILKNNDFFAFKKRTRRPPLDPVNSVMSYLYTILYHESASALSCVGLDPYVGFLHRDRSGRMSLALDLMEELRAPLVDRLTLSLINRGQLQAKHFEKQAAGAVLITDMGRKIIIEAWQQRKQELVMHPFLENKIEWGTVLYAQALLLARYIRGDLDDYPPILYKN